MSLLQAEEVSVSFPRRGGTAVQALQQVSLTIKPRNSIGLIGESGSGKSTLVRLLMGLLRPQSGRVLLDGVDLQTALKRGTAPAQRKVQMIFQDASGALNPRQHALATLSETLRHYGYARPSARQREEQALELLEQVGLSASVLRQMPRTLSGGQCQRLCIARALAARPQILIADEPVSALDVSVQARILRLLVELRQRHGLALLLVSHDLAVVRAVCDYAVVLRQGRIVEEGIPSQLFAAPQHIYTKRLVAAAPRLRGIGE